MDKEQSFDDAFAELTGPADSRPQAGEPQGEVDPGHTELDMNPGAEAGLDPEPQAKPAEADPKAEPAKTEAKPAVTLDDLAALIPADKADAFKDLLTKTKSDLHSLSSERGRQAALQRLYTDARQKAEQNTARITELEAALEAAKTPAQAKAVAAAAQAEHDKLEELFPELSDPVTMRVKALIAEHLPQPQALKPAEPAASNVQGQAPGGEQAPDPVEHLGQQYADIASAHSDWAEVVNGKNWAPWIATLPAGLQKLGDSEDPADAIWLITKHKADLAEAQARAAAARRGANRKVLEENLTPKGGAPVRVATGADDFEATFNALVERDDRRRPTA